MLTRSMFSIGMVLVIAIAATSAFSRDDDPAPRRQDRYDFRTSDEYKALGDGDREKLEQVHRDFVLLWGALEMYCDVYSEPPETLEKLTPLILRELPRDPFASADAEEPGYKYRPGAAGNRAWVISSTGLASFPYLAEKGNVGLYICKGTWISGINPIMREE